MIVEHEAVTNPMYLKKCDWYEGTLFRRSTKAFDNTLKFSAVGCGDTVGRTPIRVSASSYVTSLFLVASFTSYGLLLLSRARYRSWSTMPSF